LPFPLETNADAGFCLTDFGAFFAVDFFLADFFIVNTLVLPDISSL
jgi:hypothetical protein